MNEEEENEIVLQIKAGKLPQEKKNSLGVTLLLCRTFTVVHIWFCKTIESGQYLGFFSQLIHLWSLGLPRTFQELQKSPHYASVLLPM